MEAHVNILPVELLMHKICHWAAIRLATLPESHPLHKLVLICAHQWVKWHLSPIHVLLRTYKIKPAELEVCLLTTDVAESRTAQRWQIWRMTQTLRYRWIGPGRHGRRHCHTIQGKYSCEGSAIPVGIVGMAHHIQGRAHRHTPRHVDGGTV